MWRGRDSFHPSTLAEFIIGPAEGRTRWLAPRDEAAKCSALILEEPERSEGVSKDGHDHLFRTHFSKCVATATSVPSCLVILISAVARSFSRSIDAIV